MESALCTPQRFDVDLRFKAMRTELDSDFLFLIVKVNLKPKISGGE